MNLISSMSISNLIIFLSNELPAFYSKNKIYKILCDFLKKNYGQVLYLFISKNNNENFPYKVNLNIILKKPYDEIIETKCVQTVFCPELNQSVSLRKNFTFKNRLPQKKSTVAKKKKQLTVQVDFDIPEERPIVELFTEEELGRKRERDEFEEYYREMQRVPVDLFDMKGNIFPIHKNVFPIKCLVTYNFMWQPKNEIVRFDSMLQIGRFAEEFPNCEYFPLYLDKERNEGSITFDEFKKLVKE